jgi:hypothetical protein
MKFYHSSGVATVNIQEDSKLGNKAIYLLVDFQSASKSENLLTLYFYIAVL